MPTVANFDVQDYRRGLCSKSAAAEPICLYCSERPADSDDHVFPRFLGGKRTVAACRVCNSKFGYIFEGPAARELEPIYVLLAKWGVPLSPREQLWRNAFEVS